MDSEAKAYPQWWHEWDLLEWIVMRWGECPSPCPKSAGGLHYFDSEECIHCGFRPISQEEAVKSG